jgi:signal transduction histidine kinase
MAHRPSTGSSVSIAGALAPALLVGVVLMAIHRLIARDYLLFHSLTEIGAATISFGTFLFAWNTRRFQNSFLLVVGTASLFVGLFEALHLLAFPGMAVFTHYDDNLSPQLWLCARLFQAGSMVVGLVLIGRQVTARLVLGILAVAFVVTGAVVFLGDAPHAVVPAGGLTGFKVGMEWALVLAFACSIGLLWRVRDRFSPRVFRYLAANGVAMAAGEICFTLYSRPYDTSNFLGHVLLICAVYWQYRAILHTGLTDPNEAQFRDLMQAREESERARARLREANDSLLAADQRKNEFLALLSHELRNPLAPIVTSVYVIERAQPGSEQAKHAHEVLARQVRHMTRLVDDLLDVTRISRGKVRLQRERVDLGALVRRTAEDHRSVFAKSGVELDVRVNVPPLCLDADPTRLAQIVGNLLQNAAKFTPSGGRAILALDLDGPEVARISVSDTGAGMSPETRARVFEPFVQADATLDRSAGGLGLGLALVKGLVELHGGTVTACSEGVGTGSQFVVRLPIAQPATTTAAPLSGPAGSGVASTQSA